MYGIFLILILVVMGGVIAFIGDRLGTKIGKKKISIFGLRPRDTSTVMTIITGICITSMTLGILAITSENVRIALFGMEQLNRKISDTTEKLKLSGEELLRLQKEQDELEMYAKELVSGNEALEKEKKILTNKNSELSQENEGLEDLNNKLSEDNSSLQERNLILRKGLQTIREGEISFRAGEVISSGVISSGKTEEEIKNLLGMILQLATRNAAQRLELSEREVDLRIFEPEYEAAIKAISKSSTDTVVRIVSVGNLVKGEPVRTTLELFRNHVIYRRGEYIVSEVYKVNKLKRTDAEELVINFLETINREASSKGVLPDPVRGSVGVIEGAQFYKMVDSLVGLEGTIRLSAFAVNETDILGPLRVNFQIEYTEDS